MNIYERLNLKISNAPTIGAYNIENINECFEPEEIIHEILTSKSISEEAIDDNDWLGAYDIIHAAIHNARVHQPDAVLSFWLDD